MGWEDPIEKGKTTHSSGLAWRMPWTVQSMGSQRVRQATFLFLSLVPSQPCDLGQVTQSLCPLYLPQNLYKFARTIGPQVIVWLWNFNELISKMGLEQCLARSEHPVNYYCYTVYLHPLTHWNLHQPCDLWGCNGKPGRGGPYSKSQPVGAGLGCISLFPATSMPATVQLLEAQ